MQRGIRKFVRYVEGQDMKEVKCLDCKSSKIEDINLKLYSYGKCKECFWKCCKTPQYEMILFCNCGKWKVLHIKKEKE